MDKYTLYKIIRYKYLLPVILCLICPVAAVAQESAPSNIVDMIAETNSSLDTVWMLLAAMLVFFMQPGFALVEAGFTRTKNTANILMKNFIDFMLGSLLFWVIGSVDLLVY